MKPAVTLRREAGVWSLAPGRLVIVDEASLADTRSLAVVVAHAETAGAKVLLVGDHLQPPRRARAAAGPPLRPPHDYGRS